MHGPLAIEPWRMALLCIDLQEEHRLDERYLVEGFGPLLARVARLQCVSRAESVPVLHARYVRDFDRRPARTFEPVNDGGKPAFSAVHSPLTAICHEVEPQEDETVIVKEDASAFDETTFAPLLRGMRVEWLVVCGVWTEACIAATIRDAVAEGFRVLLVKDACGSGTRAMHETAVIHIANRLYGGAVVDTAAAAMLLEGRETRAWRLQGSTPLRFSHESGAEVYAAL